MFSNRRDNQGDSDNNNEEVSSPSLSDRLSEALPQEIVAEVLSYVPQRDFFRLFVLSKNTEDETALLRLLHCIVYAEPESYSQADKTRLALIALLKRHPELLFEEVELTVTDHAGRKTKGSPYRVLLGAGDIWALKQVHEEIIPNIKDGEATAEAQFRKQFPRCPWPLPEKISEKMLYDDRNIRQLEQLETWLKIIVEMIAADPCTDGQATKDGTRKAVAELLQSFAPKEKEVIETGLHCPSELFHKILTTYDTQFSSWTEDQLAFFSREVIGGAEAALTVVDGQCIKNGLKNLNDMKEKGPDRTDGLYCRHPKGIPGEKAPLAGKLGRTAFIDPYDGYSGFLSSTPGVVEWFNKNGVAEWCVGDGAPGLIVSRRVVEELMENKRRSLWELLCGHAHRSQHTVATSITARSGGA